MKEIKEIPAYQCDDHHYTILADKLNEMIKAINELQQSTKEGMK